METSPFSELVHAQAATGQAQHQELIALQKEKEQRFLMLLQGQERDCTTVQELLATMGPTSGATLTGPQFTLMKMGLHDDPEAFLALFAQTAKLWGWPEVQHVAHLLPVLTTEAQIMAQ